MARIDTRVLVVEDCPQTREVICELLNHLGFREVDSAADGSEALELFHRTAYGVVLTDWNMPRSSGMELLSAIRKGTERSETPVLMLTGDVTTRRVMQALAAGANGFITKPFAADVLSEKVLRLLASTPLRA